MTPEISVIFPVGDRLPFLAEAIESILTQTFTNFELLVVLDGVSEPVRACVANYTDARIRCIDLPLNMGISNARNVAISLAKAPYLALMDSDDIALPERLARQYAFLQANPQVTVCGSNAIKLLKDGRREPMRYPPTDGLIKSRLLMVDSAVLNPTAMLRSEFIHRHGLRYDANLPRDEDHRFYVEMLRHGAVFHGLQEELLLYRRHEGNITQNRERVDEEKTRVREALWPLFFPELTRGRHAFCCVACASTSASICSKPVSWWPCATRRWASSGPSSERTVPSCTGRSLRPVRGCCRLCSPRCRVRAPDQQKIKT